ncbi:hypothetical protein M5E88_12915 [Akkermansia muciniphila]|nr:hypothetical protein M5E88_12915 [Akkermansia muciniphila]
MGTASLPQKDAKQIAQGIHLLRQYGIPAPIQVLPVQDMFRNPEKRSITAARETLFSSHSRAFSSSPSSRNIRARILRASACRSMVDRLQESPISAEVIHAG